MIEHVEVILQVQPVIIKKVLSKTPNKYLLMKFKFILDDTSNFPCFLMVVNSH
jgi:hypothetical protein